MPEEYERYAETWRRHHPGWEMHLWTDANLPDLENQDAFGRGRNHSERSNVLRYELLRVHGGVYVDTDMECLRSLDPLLEGVTLFAAESRPGRLGSAIIGAVPDHPALEEAVERVSRRTGSGVQVNESGPGFLTEVMAAHPDATVFPPELFYPYSWKELYRRDEDFPEAYAVHHWSKTWETREELRVKVERLQARLVRARRAHEKVSRREQKLAARLEAIESGPWQRLPRRFAELLRVPTAIRRRVQPLPEESSEPVAPRSGGRSP